MRDQNNIPDDLTNMNSGLPSKGSQAPFSVPDGYFEGLAASILAKVKGSDSVSSELKEISPLLAGIPRQMPYSVPGNYFEENITSLPAIYHEVESPVLSVIGREMPYEVPVGYFANVSEQVLEKITSPAPKVVSIFSRTWMKMAVAAVLVGFMAIGGYNYFYHPATTVTPDSTKTAVASNQVVKDLKNVSTSEIDAFMNNVGAAPEKNTTADNGNASEKVRNMVKNIPVKELDNFLNQIPTGDDEMLASIDEP